MLDQSKDRWEDLVSWGLTDTDARHPSMVLRDKLVENEVELVERTMVTTLLTQEDGGENRVVGAMGFCLDSEEPVVVLAKATIMCAGAGAFKAPGFPVHSLTSDGDAMGYRVGDSISGKEFVDNVLKLPLAFQPGAKWRYGVSYDVIARIVEVLSGKTYGDYLKQSIFDPLGMDDTGFYVPGHKLDRYCAEYGFGDLWDPDMTFKVWWPRGGRPTPRLY